MTPEQQARAAAREGVKKANGQAYNFEHVDPMDISYLPPIPPVQFATDELNKPKGGKNA